MPEVGERSIRILFDMQACQTAGSAQRGVGRFSSELFSAVAANAGPRELHTLAGAGHPFPVSFNAIPVTRQHILDALPDWGSPRNFDGGEQDTLDAEIAAAIASRISPEVIHISHFFEGFGDRVAIPFSASRPAGTILSATLYDLIPLRFSDHYFQDRRFKKWYLQRLQWLRRADLLLSISESSRIDAIELLGIDPSRIVTIHGGISNKFRPLSSVVEARQRLSSTYGINRPKFILYTGGDDHRKNLKGAIAAYGGLGAYIRKQTQLVIVCAIEPDRKAMYLGAAAQSGVGEEDLRFVGYVPDDDLIALYSTCDLFVFPSLYEGLGLPLLEAMACGAPVIAGNNSSLAELVPDSDALFDAGDPRSIAEKMLRVLSDDLFEKKLRSEGLAHAGKFTWERSAQLAIDAFDAALERKRKAGVDASRSGWTRRQRMAMFTPLPPCRSGIADFNAQFIPYLAEHFDIDLYVDGYPVSDVGLNAAFRIFDAKDFRANALRYDVILYEFGNSEFHAHMMPLLAEFPGVVGLHDAFLSGLIGYLEFNLGHKNRYAQEMLSAHGAQARQFFAPAANHPNAIGVSMVELPCTKSILDSAIGIISHSPFNLEVARDNYPEGWRAPYRTIPQMVALPPLASAEQSRKVRAELKFTDDDFIIATFGHVAWTKCGDRLLDALLQSDLARDQRCHLVFAGELAKDDFGLALAERIRKSRLAKRIRVTGFLDERDYEKYLRVANVAVQLRTKSRGGTPKGVLDCLAHGVPVIVNNDASYRDYPDDVVMKIAADPAPADIAAALIAMDGNRADCRALGERGRTYVRDHHNPKYCAALYAAAITEFAARHAAQQPEMIASRLAPHLAGCPKPDAAAQSAAAFLDRAPLPQFERPRLVIDVSHIAEGDHGTGIPRVVRETVRAAYLNPISGFEAIAAELKGEELVPALNWLNNQGLLLPFEIERTDQSTLKLRPGDHLLMLDSSWARYGEFAHAFANARAARVPITTAVYDLLPITLPPGNIVAGGKEWFEGWIGSAVESSDNLICISKAVADDLINYIQERGIGRNGLKVGYWRLGATSTTGGDCSADSPVRAVRTPYFLMVGTIEPRKNHALALDTFEMLWREGRDLSLAIAGKPGWMVDDLLERMTRHEKLGERLFIYNQTTDAEIAYLYRHAAALFFPSKGEGFGLPLVEAAQHGTPILCSDIPAFREIAGAHASYFAREEPAHIAGIIAKWQTNPSPPNSAKIARLSWTQSTEELFGVLKNDSWYYVHGQ